MTATQWFLERILPAGCHYFLAFPPQPGKKSWKHEHFTDISLMAARAVQLDEMGWTVYYAVNGYGAEEIQTGTWDDGRPKMQQRVQANVIKCKAFYLDIDVAAGAEGKYQTRGEAITGLKAFISEVGLPEPMIVLSGATGMHCYWPLDEAIPMQQWRETAEKLKGLTVRLRFLADPAVPSDAARVLRPVGVHNRKNNGAVPVQLATDCMPITYATFAKLIDKASEKHGVVSIKTPGLLRKLTEEVNKGAGIGYESAPSKAVLISEACEQIAKMRDTGGLDEPHWYASVQLLRHTVEGEQIIHEWSAKYKGYTHSETQRKVEQLKSGNVGPTTCTRFETLNPKGCEGCKFKNQISTPLQLGRRLAEAEKVVLPDFTTGKATEVCSPPGEFKRVVHPETQEVAIAAVIDGQEIVFHHDDLLLIERACDEDTDEHMVKVRHHRRMEGWTETYIPQAAFAADDVMLKTLVAHDIIPELGKGKMMTAFMYSYLKKLQKETKARVLSNTLGWRDDMSAFQVGERVYTVDEGKPVIHRAGLSSRAGGQDTLDWFKMAGTLEEWKRAASAISGPGWEGHRFALYQAFAAPLLKIKGYGGWMVNMHGQTGLGKTYIAALLMYSVWGCVEFESMTSTMNSRMERIAAFHTLPFYMDEVTEMDGQVLSEFVYSISTGVGKGRLTKESTQKARGRWNTVVLSSSNHRLRGKLSDVKEDSMPTQMRLFEYDIDPGIRARVRDAAAVVNAVCERNYGVAGDIFAKWLVTVDRDMVAAQIKNVEDSLIQIVGEGVGERMWISALATSLYGGLVAHQLGILPYNPFDDIEWMKAQIGIMRADVGEQVSDGGDILSDFINKFSSHRLTVETLKVAGKEAVQVYKAPTLSLMMRLELDTGMMYISRRELQAYCTKHGADYTAIKRKLREDGVLTADEARTDLGRGVPALTGSNRTRCWVIDMRKYNPGGWAALVAGEKSPAG